MPRLSGRPLLQWSLARLLHRGALTDDRGTEELDGWFRDHLALGRDLAAGRIEQAAWQDGMDRLFERLDLPALRRRIDLDRVSAVVADSLDGRGEIFRTLLIDGKPPRKLRGRKASRVVVAKIAHVARGRSIPPHGHSNMVSAFLHLSGEFRVRQYDKEADDGDALVIRPTTDVVGGAGLWSSVSDDRNNIHWLTATSDDCFLFTTKLIELEEQKPFIGRINVDVTAGTPTAGALRAPKISSQRAAELYG